MQNDLKNIIESLLFVADNPVEVRALKQIIPDADVKDIRLAIAELMGEYEERRGGFLLYEVAGGFQFRSRPDYKEWIKKLVRPAPVRLSRASLETLAIIAYHQPIIRSDVEKIRGVDSGAIIRSLLERKLIRILGKKEIPGRPLIYATTRRFLEIFNLKSLSDMPSLKEIQEFGRTDLPEQMTIPMTQTDSEEEGIASEPAAEVSGENETSPTAEQSPDEGSVSPEKDADVSAADADSAGHQDEEMMASEVAEPAFPDEEMAMPEEDMDSPQDDETEEDAPPPEEEGNIQ